MFSMLFTIFYKFYIIRDTIIRFLKLFLKYKYILFHEFVFFNHIYYKIMFILIKSYLRL